MSAKKFSRQFLYRLAVASFYFFYALRCLVPQPLFRWATYPFLKLFILLAIPRKRIVRNLTAAFGKCYSDATKVGLARGVQDHFRNNLLDCLLQLGDPEFVHRSISIIGLEHLESALEKGKGVIALGAHLGNFVLVGARIGLQGYAFHTLFRIPRDTSVEGVIKRYLPRYHQRVIPSLKRRTAVKAILDALRRNEIVHILGDNLKHGTINALLFDHRVLSSRGPVSLALRSGAPLVPIYLIRNYHGQMQLVIEPPIEITITGDLAMDIAQNTRRVISYLETLIRRYPDQWNWLTIRLNRENFSPRQEPNPHKLNCNPTMLLSQK
ncbi:MAG: lysophospholipid acyltransferase family protein [Chloroflexota bacterium]